MLSRQRGIEMRHWESEYETLPFRASRGAAKAGETRRTSAADRRVEARIVVDLG